MVMPIPTRALAGLLAILLLWVLMGLAGCGRGDAAPARDPGPFRAVVTITPLEGLLKPLLPEGAEIYTVIPPGRSEHGYEFTPADVSALTKADLVLYVGLGLEPRIERHLSLKPRPTREVVSFAQAVGVEVPGRQHHHSDHEHDDGCDHGDDDPHIWLDPVLCAKLIPALRQAVERSLAGQNLATEDELVRLHTAEQEMVLRINELHEWAAEQLAPLAGKSIVTHHSAWGRLAERYGLKVAAVIRPIDAEPTPGAISATVQAIRREQVRAIFTEPQYNAAAAERIARAANVRVATLDPLGDGDWFKMMRANIESLAEALAD
jgi:zinc transport system substrate-binding protein